MAVLLLSFLFSVLLFHSVLFNTTNADTIATTTTTTTATASNTVTTASTTTASTSYTTTANANAIYSSRFTRSPSKSPTVSPSKRPTRSPTAKPSTARPSISPSVRPTVRPTTVRHPTVHPSRRPSISPTYKPSVTPTLVKKKKTKAPFYPPTMTPTQTTAPTKKPTVHPTYFPTFREEIVNHTALGFSSQVFPSASAAWVLPGSVSAPTASVDSNFQLSGLNTSAKVTEWELSHADFAFGGNYGVVANKKMIVTGYMYNQMLNFDPTEQEIWMKLLTINESNSGVYDREINYEDFFLHFTEDTEFPITDLSLGSYTSLNGKFFVTGYTNGPTHGGYYIYSGVKPWQYWNSGGCVYALSFEKFDQIDLVLDASSNPTGSFVIEYVNATVLSSSVKGSVAVSLATMQITSWKKLSLISDGTANLTRSGSIRWKPPTDWQIAATADGSGRSYGGGQFFGNALMYKGGIAYAIRIKWQPMVTSTTTTGPTLTSITQRRFIQYSVPSGALQVVPGWDSDNDVDGDGYVDDIEFAQLKNPRATARLRSQSRVFTLAKLWSVWSSGCRVNVWSGDYGRYVALWMKKTWTEQGLQGAYNDDMMLMLGPDVFPITKGGTLAEFPGKVNATDVSLAFQTKFTDVLALIKAITKSKWISGNISGENLFASAALQAFIPVLDVFLRETYFHAATGLTGYFGVQKMWDIFAYSAAGKVSVVQGMAWYGAVKTINGTSRANWQRDLTTLLSEFYLINVPQFTTFQSWGNGFYYGSSNTQSYNYYVEGVPMNVAYQPTNMMKVDIGTPKTSMESLTTMPSREFMAYQTKTKVPLSSYTVIGFSNETRIVHPELSTTGQLEMVPSFIYYLQRSAYHSNIKHTPMDCVLAREYTKGLVLYRTDVYGYSAPSFLTSSVVVTLPSGVDYRQINFDGSYGPVVRNVTMFGYEGAIFVDASTIQE